jgi:hypothetical protein
MAINHKSIAPANYNPQDLNPMMKKVLFALTAVCVAAISAPAVAGGTGSSAVGPSILFGNGNSAIGVEGKFGVSDNLSVRPLIFFPTGGTIYGASLTYDFNTGNMGSAKLSPFLGGGFIGASANGGGSSETLGYLTGGADFAVSESIDIKAAVDIPFSGGNSTTLFSVGAGFRF